jgi:hypothetical protein
MVQNDRKKEDILTFISKYYSDNAKHLDKIRIIVNRIIKEYASYKRMIHIGEIEVIDKRGRKRVKSEYKQYFGFPKEYQFRMDEFLTTQKKQYEESISNVSGGVSSSIEFLFRKLFELLEHINKLAVKKHEIECSRYRNGAMVSPKILIHKMELLNESEFEDDVIEFKNLTEKCLNAIKKAIIAS